MKIISNFKDYYDYLQGVYGIDEKVVYERTCKAWKGDWNINKSKYENLRWEKEPLHRPPHVEFPYDIDYEPSVGVSVRKPKLEKYKLAICGTIYVVWAYCGKYYIGEAGRKALEDSGITVEGSQYLWAKRKTIDAIKTDQNEKENCPVILLTEQTEQANILNVRLTDFGINQVISPHDMYVMISNFITREKPVVDTRTNVEKIEGKGFDKKTSFRHPIK